MFCFFSTLDFAGNGVVIAFIHDCSDLFETLFYIPRELMPRKIDRFMYMKSLYIIMLLSAFLLKHFTKIQSSTYLIEQKMDLLSFVDSSRQLYCFQFSSIVNYLVILLFFQVLSYQGSDFMVIQFHQCVIIVYLINVNN